MAIAYCKEVLVESLAHIGSKHEVILILLVDVVHAEALTSGVGEPSYDIILDYLIVLGLLVPHQLEGGGRSVLYSVIVVYPLVAKTGRGGKHPSCYQSLYWACHWVVVLRVQLILYKWTLRLWRVLGSPLAVVTIILLINWIVLSSLRWVRF